LTFSPLAVVIPTYNEEQGIKHTICELKEVLKEPHIIVVDGQSSDRTLKLAEHLGAEVLIQKNSGKGSAISQGLERINRETNYVILTDADFTYPAKHLKEMINVLDQNPKVGMVLGNRFNKFCELESIKNPFYVGNRILAFAQYILNGVNLNDPLTGLRIMRYKILKNWQPKSLGFDIEVELNNHVTCMGYEIVEVPIKYRPRLGKKKLGFRHGLGILKRIITQFM
jgi:glycosyltransferase involved in cell wall biosynthesis